MGFVISDGSLMDAKTYSANLPIRVSMLGDNSPLVSEFKCTAMIAYSSSWTCSRNCVQTIWFRLTVCDSPVRALTTPTRALRYSPPSTSLMLGWCLKSHPGTDYGTHWKVSPR
jgi:hypothetical protein